MMMAQQPSFLNQTPQGNSPPLQTTSASPRQTSKMDTFRPAQLQNPTPSQSQTPTLNTPRNPQMSTALSTTPSLSQHQPNQNSSNLLHAAQQQMAAQQQRQLLQQMAAQQQQQINQQQIQQYINQRTNQMVHQHHIPPHPRQFQVGFNNLSIGTAAASNAAATNLNLSSMLSPSTPSALSIPSPLPTVPNVNNMANTTPRQQVTPRFPQPQGGGAGGYQSHIPPQHQFVGNRPGAHQAQNPQQQARPQPQQPQHHQFNDYRNQMHHNNLTPTQRPQTPLTTTTMHSGGSSRSSVASMGSSFGAMPAAMGTNPLMGINAMNNTFGGDVRNAVMPQQNRFGVLGRKGTMHQHQGPGQVQPMARNPGNYTSTNIGNQPGTKGGNGGTEGQNEEESKLPSAVLGQPPNSVIVNVSSNNKYGLRNYLVRARRILRLAKQCRICGIGSGMLCAMRSLSLSPSLFLPDFCVCFRSLYCLLLYRHPL